MKKRVKRLLFIIAILFAVTSFSQDVYRTKTGEKYHKEKCHFLKYSKIKLELSKAIKLGLEPCKVCKPSPKANATHNANNFVPAKLTRSKSSTALQCTGKTKTGKRCKRKTKNSNQRCYQH